MDADMVRARVEEIRLFTWDDERAHEMEDALRSDLLVAIANGECTNPRECAQIALTTGDIEFERWCG